MFADKFLISGSQPVKMIVKKPFVVSNQSPSQRKVVAAPQVPPVEGARASARSWSPGRRLEHPAQMYAQCRH